MRRRLLFEMAGFQLVWGLCAFGAARGISAPGIAAAAIFIAVQLACSRRAGATLLTAGAAGVAGLCAEGVLAALGLVRYESPWPGEAVVPAWIVALWMAFGTTLGTLEKALGPRPSLIAAALGFVLGPISYLAGARIGALTIPDGSAVSLIAIAMLWGIALPVLMRVRRYCDDYGSTPAS